MACSLACPGFPCRVIGGYHHEAAVSHAALGDDVVRKMLNFGAAPSQGRHFHAVVIVKMDMKRRHREIMMP
jgi:hypothetical protein